MMSSKAHSINSISRISLTVFSSALLTLSLLIYFSPSVLAQEKAQTSATAQQPVVYVCPLHPDVQSKIPGKCSKCNSTLVAAVEGQDSAFYACPMHPEVTSTKADKCSKCGMSLVRMAPPETGEYQVRMEMTPAAVKAGDKVKLRFLVFHPETDAQIKEFNILHDMPFHLFVISQDLKEFQHIHPDKQSDGSFIIETVLPHPGAYKIFCDFFPAGGTPQVIQRNLITTGFSGDLLSAQAKLTPDKVLAKTVDGTRFELQFDPAEPVAGKEAVLKYHLVDARTGQPISDLQPYLSAWGHTMILSEDATDALHSHPTEMIPDGVDRSQLKTGADIAFDTFFPRPGNYRIWSQFQRQGRVITVSFDVHIPRLR
jgi:hypothetical protein